MDKSELIKQIRKELIQDLKISAKEPSSFVVLDEEDVILPPPPLMVELKEEDEEVILPSPPPPPLVQSSPEEEEQVEQQSESYNWSTNEFDCQTPEYYSFHHPHNPTDSYEDQEYFKSYSRVSIHNEMVMDKRRTAAYYHAIMGSKELFKDKVVMDIGCGTGILSCFCAIAGAKKVYAVEASDMAFNAELIVNRNNLQDVVTIVKGKLEHTTFPEFVDIIVSEWMGAFLIFESMLESVIYARDHLLKPGGTLFPSKACLYLAPIRVDSFMNEKIHCWDNVFGLDMSPLIPFAQQEILPKSIRDYYIEDPKSSILDTPQIFRYLDLQTITIQDLSKTVLNFEFNLPNGHFHGFGTWFSVWFEGLDNNYKVPSSVNEGDDSSDELVSYGIDINGEIVEKKEQCKRSPLPFKQTKNTLELSTAPGDGSTHWKHILFLFEHSKDIVSNQIIQDLEKEKEKEKKQPSVKGTMRVTQHSTYRRHWWVEFSSTVSCHPKINSYQTYLI
ncbi:protein arginine methyltransferase [Cavenderia fasciculata]|uniref:Protein arginine methyltransferase n=1 Tax=Cavenderia fasciculata TaxID=261658 RepID=F4QAT6_CACFS|nr:protein arginine methyltransferase [Cavenderia fasciculata]EGG14995.1 protein arginine methyltransferase [Cavenderia fasciculata]|eukprot:XP_004351715.1 protein arginine methyltransferase [Cavenderia fasciculata]